MKKLLLKWTILVVAIIASATIVGALPFTLNAFVIELFQTPSIPALLELFLGAGLLAFVNATIGRVLKFMTLPVSCLTFGLFALVINAALLWAVGSLGLGFSIDGFLAAFLGSILISATSAVLGVFVPDEKKEE